MDRVLFLNRSINDVFSKDCIDVLDCLRSASTTIEPTIELKESISIEDAQVKLENTDVLIMWVDYEHSGDWKKLDDFMEKQEKTYYVVFIIIFGFESDELLGKSREALLRRVHTFVCPVNLAVLKVFIEAETSKMKYKDYLAKLKTNFLDPKSLNNMVEYALNQLKEHPLIGYESATISLVDTSNSQFGERYLLKDSPHNPNPDRELQKNIQEDTLITKVIKETVFVIQNIDYLHSQDPERLRNWGWTDEDSTRHIKSWIGLAAKHQGETLAIVTINHIIADKYNKDSHELVDFLKDFSEIFADAINTFFLRRNKKLIKEIINEIGDDLDSEELVGQILQKLQKVLDCDNCNYFSVSYELIQKEIFLSEWASTKKTSEKSKHKFKKGEGIVGAVLENGKSIIVPEASEHKKFFRTVKHKGKNVSMLAVPVIPISYKNSNIPNRIIGVICCYKENNSDYFTVYDKDLVEDVALSAASVIERTLVLEASNEISSKMLQIMVDSDRSKLLKEICNHALKVTNSGSASIHLLESEEGKYRAIEYPYYTYPDGVESTPRLNGHGTTDLVIEKGVSVEFSEKLGNFDRVAENQKQKPKNVKCKLVVPLKITKDGHPSLIGALYLNKYSEEPFSKVEKFALEMLASQAASIIYDQKILYENKFRANAHKDFATVIEDIAITDNIDLLMKNVAEKSYSLVKDKNKIQNANLVSYVVICNTEGKFEVKATYPIYELTNIKNRFDNPSNKKIIDLFNKVKKPFYTNNIYEEKSMRWEESIKVEEKSIKGEECRDAYIELESHPLAILIVPIKVNDNVIGIIGVEYSLTYIFDLHMEVVNHFAKQIAIAFQKKNLNDHIKSNNKILTTLHQSLTKIMSQSSRDMLYQAVSQAREALGATKVIVIPYKNQRFGKPFPLKDEIIPPRDLAFIKDLEEFSSEVYCKKKENIYLDLKFEGESLFYGLCLPFTSGLREIGVMWIIFSMPSYRIYKERLEEDKDLYKVYANQIALAYDNAKRFEYLQKDFSDKIKIDYKDARQQAIFYFLLSLSTSIAGLVLIFSGVDQLLKSDAKSPLNGGGIAAMAGVLFEAGTILAFNRSTEANRRLDQYHQELYDVGKLSILLSATEQLDPEIVRAEKQKIIQNATNHWLQPINREKNNDKVNEVKNGDK